MAKKPDTKKIVTRMLKTSRTFTTDDYADFIKLCNKEIETRKPIEDALKAKNKAKEERKALLEKQKADIEKELQDLAKELKKKATAKKNKA